MALKDLARAALHDLGGLAALRWMRRGSVRVLMFHQFHEQTRANMERLCANIVRHYEPVSLTRVVAAFNGGPALPKNPLAVTIDDGYRNFLEQGHPVFRKFRIPTTVYAVSGFANEDLWLWPDRLHFAIEHTARPVITFQSREFDLSSAQLKEDAYQYIAVSLTDVANEDRLRVLREMEAFCQVELPTRPPPHHASLNWDEMRALATEEVEIGCHTHSHPILGRLETVTQLEAEIRGAKQLMESKLRFPVDHFCYPNGRPVDIGAQAEQCVRDAGFRSAVTCTYGLNLTTANPFQIARIPFSDDKDCKYGDELLAGLHM